jgi:hypothetical protein
MQGIADGAREQSFDISYKDILAMNGFMDIFYAQSYNSLKEQTEVRGCSAFIATGDYTKDGKIVIAHNSWTLYSQAKHLYYVVYVKPENGYAFTMQTAPGFIWSSTDWYINEKDLAVCETTLGFDGSGVAPYDEDGTRVFVRARNAVQYSSTIDEFVEMLVDNNNGAYANDWLIGDTKNNEIAILELGLNEHCLKRTTNGFFPSSNYIWCNEVRSEWFNAPAYNPPSSLRCMRLTQLCQIYRGRIDTEVAKKIISDHYDIAESKENIEGGRHLICGHMDLNETHLPAGSIDGKVADSAMIENMSFYAIAGHPCGIDFIAEEFKGLKDMIAHEWTYIDRTDINFY